jgi:ankyrin repeat protein
MDPNAILSSKCNFINDIKYILEAIVLSDNINIFKLFLKNGADPFINSNGPLKIAIRYGKHNIAELLLEIGSVAEQEFIDDLYNNNLFPIAFEISMVLQKYGYHTLY